MANTHIVPLQFVKNTYSEVFARRHYLGVVGQFYSTLWLIYPRHCTSISIKIGQVL